MVGIHLVERESITRLILILRNELLPGSGLIMLDPRFFVGSVTMAGNKMCGRLEW